MTIERPVSAQPIPDHAKKVFTGILFDVYQWEQKMFDGSTKTFEKLKRPDTVVVFPVLPDGRIILTVEEQPGTHAPSTGTISGRMEPQEDPEAAARREMLEESGYKAEELILWHALQPTIKLDWTVFTFIAKGVHKSSEQNLENGEKIILKPVTFDEMLHIGSRMDFNEKESIPHFLRAMTSAVETEKLRSLFNPST